MLQTLELIQPRNRKLGKSPERPGRLTFIVFFLAWSFMAFFSLSCFSPSSFHKSKHWMLYQELKTIHIHDYMYIYIYLYMYKFKGESWGFYFGDRIHAVSFYEWDCSSSTLLRFAENCFFFFVCSQQKSAAEAEDTAKTLTIVF